MVEKRHKIVNSGDKKSQTIEKATQKCKFKSQKVTNLCKNKTKMQIQV